MNSIDTMALMNCINSISTAQRIQFKISRSGYLPKASDAETEIGLKHYVSLLL